MYKLSELIGKEAITLSDAKKQGVLLNAHFDEGLRACKYFSLINNDDQITWVEFKNVLSFNLDAVVIRSSCDLTYDCPLSIVCSPINLKAFNQDGKSLGFIKDVQLSNDKITKFITQEGEIEPLTLLSISQEILVFNDTNKPIKLAKKPPTKKPPQPNPNQPNPNQPNPTQQIQQSQQNQQIQQSQQNQEPNQSISQPQQATNPPLTPSTQIKKVIPQKTDVYRSPANPAPFRYGFLLGKRLQRSIYDPSGAILAQENELVTEKLILKAKQVGKLVTLALHSL